MRPAWVGNGVRGPGGEWSGEECSRERKASPPSSPSRSPSPSPCCFFCSPPSPFTRSLPHSLCRLRGLRRLRGSRTQDARTDRQTPRRVGVGVGGGEMLNGGSRTTSRRSETWGWIGCRQCRYTLCTLYTRRVQYNKSRLCGNKQKAESGCRTLFSVLSATRLYRSLPSANFPLRDGRACEEHAGY